MHGFMSFVFGMKLFMFYPIEKQKWKNGNVHYTSLKLSGDPNYHCAPNSS